MYQLNKLSVFSKMAAPFPGLVAKMYSFNESNGKFNSYP